MFKLVVLSAILALAAAKPSLLHAPLVHSAVVAPAYHTAYLAAPSAVSHQSRVDVHSTPVITSYAAPVVASYAAPIHSAWASPLALGPYTSAAVLGPHGVPLDTAEVVAAKAVHYQAHALANHGLGHHYLKKRSVLPLAYTAVVAPSAVSHQSRVDVHSSPALIASPLVHSYAAAPLVSHYASPYVSAYSSPIAAHGLWAPRAYGVHPW